VNIASPQEEALEYYSREGSESTLHWPTEPFSIIYLLNPATLVLSDPLLLYHFWITINLFDHY
jgi:hypothetical protein